MAILVQGKSKWSRAMWQILRKKAEMPTADRALPGRPAPGFAVPATHFVNGNRIQPPFLAGLEMAMFGMGCFWGAERLFWELGDGIYVTAAGYAGGFTPNPTYEEVCSGSTGHAETVLVAFHPARTSYGALLKTFWESHDPTQGIKAMMWGRSTGPLFSLGIRLS
jgi:peptide-methionine (S)-S-oxide reductase